VDANVRVSEDNGQQVTLTYKSDDTTVATVDSSGKIHGVAPGRAVITASVKETNSVSPVDARITVTVGKVVPTIEVAKTKTVALDTTDPDQLKLNAKVTNNNDYAMTLSYQSSNTGVVVVNNQGSITPRGIGTATITITARGNSGATEEVRAEVKVTVTQGRVAFDDIGVKTGRVVITELDHGPVELDVVTVGNKATDGNITYELARGDSHMSMTQSGKLRITSGITVGNYPVTIKVKAAETERYNEQSNTYTTVVYVERDKVAFNGLSGGSNTITATQVPSGGGNYQGASIGDKRTDSAITYEVVSVSPSANITVDRSTGRVNVPRGLTPQTYSVTIRAKSEQTGRFEAQESTTTVSVTVRRDSSKPYSLSASSQVSGYYGDMRSAFTLRKFDECPSVNVYRTSGASCSLYSDGDVSIGQSSGGVWYTISTPQNNYYEASTYQGYFYMNVIQD
jgi:hypothetical protein